MRSATPTGLSAVAAIVRRHDRDRFQTALFAPAARREQLFALYAFNYEIARIRDVVREPMLGRIRLQWWREIIEAAYAGAPPRQHEVALPLAAAIRDRALSHCHFARLIDARERDLDAAPPPTLALLEAYAEDSSAALVHLALEILGQRAEAPHCAGREVGIGYALVGLLRAMPFHALAGRSYIPADIADRAGLGAQDYSVRPGTPALRRAAADLAETAAGHLRRARRDRAAIPPPARAALLPAVIATRYLARLRAARFDPFAPGLVTPDPLQAWRLAIAALTGRF